MLLSGGETKPAGWRDQSKLVEVKAAGRAVLIGGTDGSAAIAAGRRARPVKSRSAVLAEFCVTLDWFGAFGALDELAGGLGYVALDVVGKRPDQGGDPPQDSPAKKYVEQPDGYAITVLPRSSNEARDQIDP